MGLTAEQQLRILISTDADLSGLNKAIGSFKRLEQLGKAGLGLNKAGKIIDMTTGRFVSVAEAAAKAEKSVARFDMRLLSVLFAGMALQRTGAAFFKFAFNKWEQYEGYQSASLTKTMELTAAWEFFRFSIFNALGQSDLFVGFIDFVVKAVNWISGFINRFPELATAIAAVFGVFVVGGSVMLILAQFKLAWDALFGAGGFLATSAGKGIGSISGKIDGLKSLLGAGFGFWLVWEGWKNFKEGNLAGIFGDLATGVILWTAGLGYAVPFYLAFKGLQMGVPKLQEKIAEKQEFFPEDLTIGKILSNFFPQGSAADKAMERILKIFKVELPSALDENSTRIKILEDGTKLLTVAFGAQDEILTKKSLVPSMILLNTEYTISNEQITSLSGKYPILIEQTNILTTSVNALAFAYERLTKVQTAPSSRFGQTNRHTSSVFG